MSGRLDGKVAGRTTPRRSVGTHSVSRRAVYAPRRPRQASCPEGDLDRRQRTRSALSGEPVGQHAPGLGGGHPWRAARPRRVCSRRRAGARRLPRAARCRPRSRSGRTGAGGRVSGPAPNTAAVVPSDAEWTTARQRPSTRWSGTNGQTPGRSRSAPVMFDSLPTRKSPRRPRSSSAVAIASNTAFELVAALVPRVANTGCRPDRGRLRRHR